LNRMRSMFRASWQNAPACPFLLAALLAGSSLLGAQTHPAPQPVEMLDGHAAAKLLIHVAKPDYPAIAKVNLIRGSVKLEITVDPRGKVVEVHVVDGEPLLAAAAIQAVRKWLYQPYISSEGPAPFRTNVVVSFALRTHVFAGRFPRDPEGYLEKQIHPPVAISSPRPDSAAAGVLLKVLVDSEGNVLDASAIEAKGAEVELARKNLRRWKFRPARWGTLAVPWYIMVRVPIEPAMMDQAANTEKRPGRIAP
jgi:TonB family protein